MTSTATLATLAALTAGTTIRLHVTNGDVVLGSFSHLTDEDVHVVRNFGRTGTAVALAGVASVELVTVDEPCAAFTGSGRRCTECRYAKHMH